MRLTRKMAATTKRRARIPKIHLKMRLNMRESCLPTPFRVNPNFERDLTSSASHFMLRYGIWFNPWQMNLSSKPLERAMLQGWYACYLRHVTCAQVDYVGCTGGSSRAGCAFTFVTQQASFLQQ